jgi:hypothetical protein
MAALAFRRMRPHQAGIRSITTNHHRSQFHPLTTLMPLLFVGTSPRAWSNSHSTRGLLFNIFQCSLKIMYGTVASWRSVWKHIFVGFLLGQNYLHSIFSMRSRRTFMNLTLAGFLPSSLLCIWIHTLSSTTTPAGGSGCSRVGKGVRLLPHHHIYH